MTGSLNLDSLVSLTNSDLQLLKSRLGTLPASEQSELLELLEEMEKRKDRRKLNLYFNTPEVRASYKKQMQFFALGKNYTERLLAGGNRSGKSLAGGFEMTTHLTGLY